MGKEHHIILGPDDRVIVKQLWKFPVPTAHEIKLLVDFFDDYTPIKVALGLTIVDALRPIENSRLRWPQFTIENGRVKEFWHYINKPVGRTTRLGKNYEEKAIKKPVYEWSKWLSDQLIGLAKRSPKLESDHLFMWNNRESMTKYLSNMRKEIKSNPKEYGSEYNCFFDKNSYVRIGFDQPIPFRINWYSIRRFSMTFHFYVTFKQDPIATAKAFGHSEAATTLGHYIMPKEAIGLTQEMIDNKISIDEFIHLHGKKQMLLVDYNPEWEKRFTPVGQRHITDFSEIEMDC